MKVKFLTKEIEKQLMKNPIGCNNNLSICKFFNPYGAGTWWVFEGEKLANGDWEFYGIAEIYDREFGYFTLSELESVRVNVFGEKMPLERDKYYTPETKEEIINS